MLAENHEAGIFERSHLGRNPAEKRTQGTVAHYTR